MEPIKISNFIMKRGDANTILFGYLKPPDLNFIEVHKISGISESKTVEVFNTIVEFLDETNLGHNPNSEHIILSGNSSNGIILDVSTHFDNVPKDISNKYRTNVHISIVHEAGDLSGIMLNIIVTSVAAMDKDCWLSTRKMYYDFIGEPDPLLVEEEHPDSVFRIFYSEESKSFLVDQVPFTYGSQQFDAPVKYRETEEVAKEDAEEYNELLHDNIIVIRKCSVCNKLFMFDKLDYDNNVPEDRFKYCYAHYIKNRRKRRHNN